MRERGRERERGGGRDGDRESQCVSVSSDSKLAYIFSLYLRRTVEHLGSGQFGTVEKGVWKCPRGEEEGGH